MPLKVGDPAPDFELMNQDKQKISLSSLRGKTVVLLFYPMDFSPVCTTEHCSFGEAHAQIARTPDTVIFGVSCDSPFSHKAYQQQYNIPYDLLADPTRKMAKAYDMWAGEEPFNCSKRGTVVIDKHGRIAVYEPVDIPTVRKVEDIAAAAARG